MQTREILTAPEAEVVVALRSMKLKELEKHADKISAKLRLSYHDLLVAVVKLVPELDTSTAFLELQAKIKELVDWQGVEEQDEQQVQRYIERLSVVMMVVITEKFNKIHQHKR